MTNQPRKEGKHHGNDGTSVRTNRTPDRGSNSNSRVESFRIVVASIVTLIWSAMYVRTVFDPKFHAPPELSLPMMTVAGWLYGSAALREFGKKQNDDS